MKPTLSWYAVYTRPRWEKRVASLLRHKGLESYCPLNQVLHQWHDRKKVAEEPLFASYVFVRTTEAALAEARKTEGVINLLYWLGSPALIRQEEIEAIRSFVGEHRQVRVEKTRIRVQDRVQTTDGALLHREAAVPGVHHRTIKVLLPSLGYALTAHVENTKTLQSA